MKEISLKMIASAAILLLIACSSTQETEIPVSDWPWGGEEETIEPSDSEPNKAYVDAGWTNVKDTYGELPQHINVYKSPSELVGKAAVAYIAVAEPLDADWDVWSVVDVEMDGTTDSYKTPSEVYESGSWPVIVNGGYFYYSGGNYTSSLAVSEGELLAYNINYASEDWETIYYPTRAAFLEKKNGTFDACWTYNTSSAHYTYQTPSENSYDKDPQPVPSATFPETAVPFEAQTAIGGGPVLINAGEIVNSWSEEMFDKGGVNPTSNQPRTAIGVTADKKLILFVCEGRNMTEGVAGLTTGDVAEVLLSLGCVEAINLDGGGSSCMLVNGKETIKVSDGKQRSVASTVMFR